MCILVSPVNLGQNLLRISPRMPPRVVGTKAGLLLIGADSLAGGAGHPLKGA